MAINYTTSYTFSPNTTISSSQVNTNFSDNTNTWTGLEALTKSFAALRVDATPTASTDVAIKSYVDKLNAYRRPLLQYSSATAINLETGLTGTSGQAAIVFPDGNYRTDSTTSRINFAITQNAALSGTAQSGLRTSLSEAVNTWYSLYAVKVSDSTTNFVTVGDTLVPTQANYSTLNSNFGTSSWVYLGVIPNGDNSGATGDIPAFSMCGAWVYLRNANAGTNTIYGVTLASATATNITWTYAAGTALGSAQVPAQIIAGDLVFSCGAQTTTVMLDAAGSKNVKDQTMSSGVQVHTMHNWALTQGYRENSGTSVAKLITLAAYSDSVLSSPFALL